MTSRVEAQLKDTWAWPQLSWGPSLLWHSSGLSQNVSHGVLRCLDTELWDPAVTSVQPMGRERGSKAGQDGGWAAWPEPWMSDLALSARFHVPLCPSRAPAPCGSSGHDAMGTGRCVRALPSSYVLCWEHTVLLGLQCVITHSRTVMKGWLGQQLSPDSGHCWKTKPVLFWGNWFQMWGLVTSTSRVKLELWFPALVVWALFPNLSKMLAGW